MIRRIAIALSVLVVAWLPLPAHAADPAAQCMADGGIYLYIRNWDQPVTEGCTYGGTGYQRIQELTSMDATASGFICRIGGYPSDQPCEVTPQTQIYWTYWWWRDGSWVYATVGGGYAGIPGTAEVWNWSDGFTPPSVIPPDPASASAPEPPAPAPEPPKPAPDKGADNGGNSNGNGHGNPGTSDAGHGTTSTNEAPAPEKPAPESAAPSSSAKPSASPSASTTPRRSASASPSVTPSPSGSAEARTTGAVAEYSQTPPWGPILAIGGLAALGAGYAAYYRRRRMS